MTLFENDLFVIVRLAFPLAKKIIVLDPAKAVLRNFDSGFFFAYTREQVMSVSQEKKPFLLVNLSGAASFSFPFDFSKVEGIVSFNSKAETSLDFFHFGLFLVVDQQNRLRWLISEYHTQTDFLDDYIQPQFVTDVSNFFSGFKSLANYIRVKSGNLKKVVDGNIQILKRERQFFDCLANDEYSSFTINLNSHTAQGLIRIKLYNKNKYSWVINHAINPSGREKISNESMILSEIGSKYFNHFGIPDFFSSENNNGFKIGPQFKTSESRTTVRLINSKLTEVVLEYQSLYVRQTELKKYFKSIEIITDFNWIRTKISNSQIPRGISAINLTKLYSNLLKIFNDLDLNASLFLSLNNNLLYSENIFSCNEKLYFTSWVNADFDLPIFYDLFRKEIFYAEETESNNAEMISERILNVLKEFTLLDFSEKNNINTGIQFKVFVISTLVNELKQLLVKKVVMPQANVKIFNWLSLTETTKIYFKIV
jgi:hypothetical protein